MDVTVRPEAAAATDDHGNAMRDVRDLSFPSAERVFGRDDRVKVLNVGEPPWCRICALRIHCRSGTYAGTGWILGRHTVVTAGHCVYFPDQSAWASQIEVLVPRRDGGWITTKSSEFRATRDWTRSDRPTLDVGVIVVPDPIGDVNGTLPFAAGSDEELSSTLVTVSGYPADLDDGEVQYNDTLALLRVTTDRLEYAVDTFGGQSGAPVLGSLDGSRRVVGIHVGGDVANNTAVRIVPDVLHLLDDWRALVPR